MTWHPWTQPFTTTLSFDGTERTLTIARLSVADKANYDLGLSRLQGTRGVLADAATVAERDAWYAEQAAENERKGAWLNEVVARDVRIPEPWTSADGIAVATAEDLLVAYQDEAVLTAIVLAIWMQNRLSAALRKNLPSPSALVQASVEAKAARIGETPGSTVAPADASASVPPVTVMAVPSEVVGV